MNMAYVVPGLMIMAMPVLTPLGLAASFLCPVQPSCGRRFARNTKLAILYVALCTCAVITLRQDPGRVVEWWFD